MKTKKKPDWLVLRIVKALGINNGWSKKRAVNKEVSFYGQYIPELHDGKGSSTRKAEGDDKTLVSSRNSLSNSGLPFPSS